MLANQTHHTAPVNFRVFVPAYVHYEMLLYILMEYCTLVSITAWGESLKCPIHQCQTIGMYILKFQLNVLIQVDNSMSVLKFMYMSETCLINSAFSKAVYCKLFTVYLPNATQETKRRSKR